jgi:LmbE family N-acetylglucosaminyl deacetylase
MKVSLTGLDTVLCLGAHADDIEIGCGGTILRLKEENPGLKVYWVVLSADGERSNEARDSAHTLLGTTGEPEVRIAEFRETYFPYIGDKVKGCIAALRSTIAPDLIFTHWLEDSHQDHRIVGESTWQTFRDHLILEYEIPKWDGDMGRPNVFATLDRSVCERKVDHLLQAFPSQTAKDWFDAEVFWGLLRLRGMEARSPSRYAEAFYCRKLLLG